MSKRWQVMLTSGGNECCITTGNDIVYGEGGTQPYRGSSQLPEWIVLYDPDEEGTWYCEIDTQKVDLAGLTLELCQGYVSARVSGRLYQFPLPPSRNSLEFGVQNIDSRGHKSYKVVVIEDVGDKVSFVPIPLGIKFETYDT